MTKRLTLHLILSILSFIFLTPSFAQDITITTDTTFGPGAYTYDNVFITNSSTLIFNGAVSLNTQNLTIDPGSSISSDAKGYPAAQGPGAGISGSYRGSGAGYGGKGGNSLSHPGGANYGSSLTPQDLGSGGGNSQAGLLTLNSGQILQLKLKQGDVKWKIKEKDDKGIEIQAPSIIFKATTSDYADNIAIKELEFTKEKNEKD